MDSCDIDRIDGYSFEELVHRIFSRHGFICKLMPKSGDGGIDVIAVKSDQEFLIECKHWRSNAGRPIVQKLHSAILTHSSHGNRLKKGIVVCTANFSPDAKEYAAKIGGIIELWDYHRIKKFAYDIGLILYSSRSGDAAYFGIEARDESGLKRQILADYIGALRSHPRNSIDACRIDIAKRSLSSAIQVSYTLNKPFSTSIGQIHRAYGEGHIFVPLDDGKAFDQAAREYLAGATTTRLKLSEIPAEIHGKFSSETKIREELRLRQTLSSQYTKTVEYSGQNNQQYSRVCTVTPQDIKLNSRDIVYCTAAVNVSFGPHLYTLTVVDDAARRPHIFKVSGFDYGSVDFLNRRASLCNDCGAITPMIRSHTCDICKRTLCPKHIWSIPLNLFSRVTLCHTCFDEAVSGHNDAGRELQRRSDVAISDGKSPNGFISFMARPFGSLALFIIIVIGVGGGLVARILSKAYRHQDPNITALVIFGLVTVLGLAFYNFNRSTRRKTVLDLKKALQTYQPPWQ